MKFKDPKTPREFFSTLNLSALPEEWANYIRDEILTTSELDKLSSSDPEFVSFEEMIHEKWPSALVDKVPPTPVMVETPVVEIEPVVETAPPSKDVLSMHLKFLKRMLASATKTPAEKEVLNKRIKIMTKLVNAS